jgi:hypothetical protein
VRVPEAAKEAVVPSRVLVAVKKTNTFSKR